MNVQPFYSWVWYYNNVAITNLIQKAAPRLPFPEIVTEEYHCCLAWDGGWKTCHSLHWRHNGHDCVSNHQPHDCLLNRIFEHRSKKTSKLRVTGLCAGNSPGTGEFSAQMASDAEKSFHLMTSSCSYSFSDLRTATFTTVITMIWIAHFQIALAYQASRIGLYQRTCAWLWNTIIEMKLVRVGS